MKTKLLFLSFVVLLTGTSIAQTIVSTTPENKKVILEEFTGIYCQFCPDGHAIAQAIQDNNPGDVFLINIHVGGFANPGAGDPDFRTPFGTAIANQSGLIGYPAGTVNRHVFPGQSQSGGNDTAMSRGQWASAANQTLGQASYLNMATEAEIDVLTNELTVHVEAYYTANSPVSTNKLNVALLQNNTLGPQTGGGMGDEYVHQHRLVYLLTGQWGEDITTTSSGDFVDRTYTYTIPSSYNNVPVQIDDLEVVVFMTETTQEIISGNGATPTYINLPASDASLLTQTNYEEQCGIDFAPTVSIENRGANTLTSKVITYSINGGDEYTYTWTGSLETFESEEVTLDPIPYTIQPVNTVNFSIPNDGNNANNTASKTFNELTDENTSTLNLRIAADNNGSEITWEIVNINGDVVESGGPYDNNESVNVTFNLDDVGCHQFNIYDAGGNGDYYVRLIDSQNSLIYFSNSEFGSRASANFKTNGVLGQTENLLSAVAIYPNPANEKVTIVNANGASIALYDMLGKLILSETVVSNRQEVTISNLEAGTYFVTINKDGQLATKKLIVQ